MKSKLMVFGFILALVIVIAGAQNAHAGTWAYASIDQVGQDVNNSIVLLTHVSDTPAFTKKWFHFAYTKPNQMLALALTAVSLGKNVLIEINDDGVTIDKIRIAY